MDLTAGAELGAVRAETGATAFEGYEKLSLDSTTVTALLVGGVREAKAAAGASVEIVLNKTPFYAEGGGQCGDRGTLESSSGAVVRVLDVQRAAGGDLWVHKAEVVSGEVQVRGGPGIVSLAQRTRVGAEGGVTTVESNPTVCFEHSRRVRCMIGVGVASNPRRAVLARMSSPNCACRWATQSRQ